MSTYLLFIELSKPVSIQVGKLGRFSFPAGQYIYIGRAKKNLEARLARHQRKDKTCHWHIDYILQYGNLKTTKTYDGDDECGLARFLASQPGVTIPVRKLGSTDCSCDSHFFKWDDRRNFFEIYTNISRHQE